MFTHFFRLHKHTAEFCDNLHNNFINKKKPCNKINKKALNIKLYNDTIALNYSNIGYYAQKSF